MDKSFPFQCVFSASLPTFQKGVHCTKALHPLTRAVQCAVRFSTLLVATGPVAPEPGNLWLPNEGFCCPVLFGTALNSGESKAAKPT